MGILVLESSVSNGSEVGAVLAIQENSYDDVRVVSGQKEQWPNHRRSQPDGDVKKNTHITAMAGPLNVLATIAGRLRVFRGGSD